MARSHSTLGWLRHSLRQLLAEMNHNDLVKQTKQKPGVKAKEIAVEVGGGGCAEASAYNLYKQPGIKGQEWTRTLKRLLERKQKKRIYAACGACNDNI